MRGFRFVLTGRLNRPRYDFEHEIEVAGHTMDKAITHQTDFLVAGEGPWGNKHKKAEKLGVTVISEPNLKTYSNNKMTTNNKTIEQCRATYHKEYGIFMEKYKTEHEVCPNCGRTEYGSTYCGYVLDLCDQDNYKDLNQAYCECKYPHTIHDRISVFEFNNK